MAIVNDDKKNARVVRCTKCRSRVLSPGVAELVEKEFSLPQMTFKAKPEGESASSDAGEQPGLTADTYTSYWLIGDIFHFDNVGVSREVVVDGKTVKYLTCADCEIGPIGWYHADNKAAIYLCKDDRVQYD